MDKMALAQRIRLIPRLTDRQLDIAMTCHCVPGHESYYEALSIERDRRQTEWELTTRELTA